MKRRKKNWCMEDRLILLIWILSLLGLLRMACSKSSPMSIEEYYRRLGEDIWPSEVIGEDE